MVILPQNRKALIKFSKSREDQRKFVADLVAERALVQAPNLLGEIICLLCMSTNPYLPSIWISLEARWTLGWVMKESHDGSRLSYLRFKLSQTWSTTSEHARYLVIKIRLW